jgi:hypothetical protein
MNGLFHSLKSQDVEQNGRADQRPRGLLEREAYTDDEHDADEGVGRVQETDDQHDDDLTPQATQASTFPPAMEGDVWARV